MLVFVPFEIFPSYVFQLIKMSKWLKKIYNNNNNEILSPIHWRLNIRKHSQNVNMSNQKAL